MRNWFFEQMAMYSAYHRDGRNQATHHVGVPMIVFSLLLLAAPVTLTVTSAGPLSLAAVLIGVLLIAYIIAMPLVGTIAVLIYGALTYAAEGWAAGMTGSTHLMASAGLFVLGWAIQFIGHGFEGRKPALFDNLVQIFMAPAFLIAEVLFAAGLEQGLKAEIDERMPKYLPADALDGPETASS